VQNPFIFGKVVAGDWFVDREEETATIAQTLLSGQNVICYSPRRYGKTSLMMRVREDIVKKGRLVFFIDLFRVTSLDDLYSIYANSVIGAIRSPLKNLIATIQGMFPTINPKIVFKSPESPTIEISSTLPLLGKPATLRELFDSLENYCGKKGKKGVVMFDEFQEITALPDGALIEREMRSAFQHHKHVSYVFLGSKNHLLKDLFRDKNRPFYNFGRHFELGVIGTDHWLKYIADRMGPDCSTEHIAAIIDTTQNHPYYTQMFCHYLWEKTTRPRRRVTTAILDDVIREILERDSLHFSEFWDDCSTMERHLIKALAIEETQSIYEKRFMLTHNLGSASSIQKAAGRLIRLDYLKKEQSGAIRFVNPFFKLWIRQGAS
jgi:AAA+ ATPase superfamily predicted ATPase